MEGTVRGWVELADLRLAACPGGSVIISRFQEVIEFGGSWLESERKLVHFEICG